MRFDPQAGVLKSKEQEGVRRSSGRLPQEGLKCNLGTVLELSAGGMSILCRRRPSKKTKVYIKDHALPGPLHAVVTWSKRTGLFKHEVGLKFEDVSPEMAKQLSSIAGTHRFRRVM